MSENMLIFIPADSQYIPDSAAILAAQALLKTLLPFASEITFYVAEEVEFVSCGGNMERVLCPVCRTVLDERWWTNAMDSAYGQSKFTNLAVELPCCHASSSLNDLCYEWPMGFARFQLIVRDAEGDVAETALQALKELLGCALKKIWAHF